MTISVMLTSKATRKYAYIFELAHSTYSQRSKENLKSNYGGPSRRQASGTNQRIKALLNDSPDVKL